MRGEKCAISVCMWCISKTLEFFLSEGPCISGERGLDYVVSVMTLTQSADT